MSETRDVLPPEAQPKAAPTETGPVAKFWLPPTLEEVLATFAYHKPTDEQVERIAAVREGAQEFARAIWANVASGPDRTVALRKVHEAMMTANKAIVCEGTTNG